MMKGKAHWHSPGLLDNISQYTNGFVIAEVLKTDAVHFKDHVARLNATVKWHCTTAHQ